MLKFPFSVSMWLNEMTWTANVTVAAVIEKSQKFLMVKEHAEGGIVYNQPAGHLEPNESLIDAVIREVKEETACDFSPEKIVGIYLSENHKTGKTYLRIAFCGAVTSFDAKQQLDDDIIEATWLTYDEICRQKNALRSPMVLSTLDDYRNGQHYPLEILKKSTFI